MNVGFADAIFILSDHPEITGGTLLTLEHARKTEKPHLIVTPENLSQVPLLFRQFIDHHKVKILNTAGPRASSSPTIYKITFDLLQNTFE